MKISKLHGGLSALLVVLSLTFTSCLKDLSGNDEPQDAAALNVVNASPGSLTVNFFLDNNLVNGPALGFGQESGYILAATGNRRFNAAPGGTFSSAVADTVTLEKDKYYTMFVAGENTALTTFFTEDDLTLPESGKAKIRFINLSPDGGTMSLALQGGATLFSGQGYKTGSAFITVNAGSAMLELRRADGSVAFELGGDFAAGKIYTAWAGGLSTGTDNTSTRLFVRANN